MSTTGTAQCPVCSTPISQTRYAEIQERIRKEEQGKLAAQAAKLRAQHEVELKKATSEAIKKAEAEAAAKVAKAQANEKKQAETIAKLTAAEAKAREDASKTAQQLKAQHEAALKKVRAEAAKKAEAEVASKLSQLQANERKQAELIAELKANEAKARENAAKTEQQMKAQHEAALKKVADDAAKEARAALTKELKAKDDEVRAVKEAHGQELKQQRELLDQHRDAELLKVRSEQAKTTEALQKKVQELSRKLEQKTAHELGEFPEIDLYDALREAFPGDSIMRVKKGEPGADIIHKVMHNGQHCQTIVYDSKNRRLWHTQFVQKLLMDKSNAKAEHAILVSAVFPSPERDLCVKDGVVVAKASQVVTVAKLLRDSIITDHLRNLSLKDRTEKKERLYALITSEMFRQRMAAVDRAIRELEKIDAKEMEDHRRVWTARVAHYRTADKSVRDLLAEISAILESSGFAAVATGTDDAVPAV